MIAWKPDRLPTVLSIFSPSGVLLLPKVRVVLNLVEPRYRAMIGDCLATLDRLIGIIQPLDPKDPSHRPKLYEIGCAGRLVDFEETPDGRYRIKLLGISRFVLCEELPCPKNYRTVRVDWQPFAGDLYETKPKGFDRPRLLHGLQTYLNHHRVLADWCSIERAPDEALVAALATICPFTPEEKQALLESANTEDRASTMIALFEMARAGSQAFNFKH